MLLVEIPDVLIVVRITLFVLGVSTYKTRFPSTSVNLLIPHINWEWVCSIFSFQCPAIAKPF